MNPIPLNAQSLIDFRVNGRVPELPVLISLIGPLDFMNIVLHAEGGKSYDWRSIAALEIEIFADVSVPFPKLLRTLADIAAAVPRHMVLSFSEGACIDCGEMHTVTDFAVFDWFPMAIRPHRAPVADQIRAWNDGQAIARKLLSELGHRLPIPYDKALDLVGQIIGGGRSCA